MVRLAVTAGLCKVKPGETLPRPVSGTESIMVFPKRFLVRFGAKQTTHLFTDILIIGGGIAGFRAALEVPSDQQVLLITKDRVQLSNSSWAQGGIAAVRAPEDRFE